MSTRIKAPFATARKTAAVLGVSKSRFKVLERLARANTIFTVKASSDSHAVGKDSPIYFEKSAHTKSSSPKSKSKVRRKNRKASAKAGNRHSRA